MQPANDSLHLPLTLDGQARDISPEFIAARIRSGDRAIETEFCRRYYPSVFRILLRYTRDSARAEDITQDVLMTVILRLRSSGIDHPEHLSRFVHQTARYAWLGWSRQSDNQVQLFETMDHEPCRDSSTVGAVIHDEQRQLVAELIERLVVPRDRELLFRCYVCDETKQAVCDALSLTATHFDRVISRARKRLRQVADDQDQDILDALCIS